MMKFKSLFRRQGGTASAPSTGGGKVQGQQLKEPHKTESSTAPTEPGGLRTTAGGEGLKKASSVSSLDSKHNKAKPGSKKNHHNAHANHKHKISGGGTNMVDLDLVKKELERITKEKAVLESRVVELSTYQGEIVNLRKEVTKLKEDRATEMEELAAENCSLRARLHEAALSDSEKDHLLLDTAVVARLPHSAPASMMAAIEAGCEADWDRQSNSSLSEVSVACLQDRIHQMEETHHSTNEELQATLQELTDLQAQLSELQSDNERLSEEKSVLLESLCTQTEKLEDSRTRVDTLQGLLVRDGGEEVASEREYKLVDLLKSAQEEREALLLKQEDLSCQLSELGALAEQRGQEAARLEDRVRLLESTVDAAHAERKQLDRELAGAREESSGRSIECSRLSTLLDNARAKIEELEQARSLGDKSDADELLDNARREKDELECRAASLQEQLSLSQCEASRLKEQLSSAQEECKVTRNNAKSALSDLEYQCDTARQEKSQLAAELQSLQDSASELKVQCQCHLEDKRQLKAVLSETQRHLGDTEQGLADTERSLAEEQRLRREESTEWEQFQSDLLMTVRVANDFKTEAQTELEKLVMENKALRDRVRGLEAQLDKTRAAAAAAQKPSSPVLRSASAPLGPGEASTMLSSVQQEMAVRRQHKTASRQDSRLSVKSLIESLENATKQAKGGPGSRSSSTSSLSSAASAAAPTSPLRPLGDGDQPAPLQPKTPLRDQQQSNNQTSNNSSSGVGGNNGKQRRNQQPDHCFAKLHDSGKMGPGGQKPQEEVILGGKGIDFSRRNSYGDLSERKDPLSHLVRNGGSKRNALLKWCQCKAVGYRGIDITNFSSSWNDGLALCAMLHSYLPERVPYDSLVASEKRRNFAIAFEAAESVGIPTTLNISDMIQLERPDWNQVMAYVTAIYKHFET